MLRRLGSLLAMDGDPDPPPDIPLTAVMLRGQEQIEYYLSPANLDQDSFFRSQLNSNPDGFIPISVFLGCNRVKQLGITADDLLFACSHSPFLEVRESAIRPKTPYRTDARRKHKTVRISGFSQGETAASIYAMLSELTKPPQNVLCQYRQDDGMRVFRGCAEVLYFSETDANAACEKEIFCGDQKLAIEPLDAYEQKLRRSQGKSCARQKN
jgi:hypothetical protein